MGTSPTRDFVRADPLRAGVGAGFVRADSLCARFALESLREFRFPSAWMLPRIRSLVYKVFLERRFSAGSPRTRAEFIARSWDQSAGAAEWDATRVPRFGGMSQVPLQEDQEKAGAN